MQSRRFWVKWIGRIVISIIVLLLILVISGMVYQQIATAEDLKAYPPPGELVTVGDLQMHLYCEGEGSPTIVFEAGLGADSIYWWQIQRAIAEDTRACVYDRAGMGWSDFADTVLTIDQIVDNLHLLLQNAGIDAPYVLVGHSAGGIPVREFARQFPEEVAGIVLVDSSHENQTSRFPQEIVDLSTSATASLQLCRFVAPIGIFRLLNIGDEIARSIVTDEEMVAPLLASFNRSHFCPATLNEYSGFISGANQDTPPQSLGDLPLFVLTAGESVADNPTALASEIPIEIFEEQDAIWLELQSELAALSTNSTHIVVEDAGHTIHIDQPTVVIDAIRQLLASIAGS